MRSSKSLADLAGHLIDAVRVNVTQPQIISGRTFWLKRRRPGFGSIIAAGNIFLKWSNSHILMFPKVAAWQDWELHSYRLLYGDDFPCEKVGSRAIRIPQVPGQRLSHYHDNGALSETMFQAAAHEFRRVHRLISPLMGSGWSHGDPHLDNVLYDAETGQAHLIDFETRHETGLQAEARWADDLLVFLLDLLGKDPTENWQKYSQIFLAAYGDGDVLRHLADRLTLPYGLERVLWKTRTHYLNTHSLKARLVQLRAIVEATAVP